ncbi:MAG: MoaD/ThiS family protein [Anaerolineaceae bacterium]
MQAVLILRDKEIPVDAGKPLLKTMKGKKLIPESYLAVRDGEMITEDEIVRPGDRIQLVPVISGGSRP